MALSNENNLSPASSRDAVGAYISQLLMLPDRIAKLEQRVQTLAKQCDELHSVSVAPTVPKPAEPMGKDTSAPHGELLSSMQQSLELLAAEQTRLGELHYQEHIIVPLVQRLAMVYDVAMDTCRAMQLNAPGADSPCGAMLAIAPMILELLACYGVRPLNASPGQDFDSGTMSVQNASPHDRAEGNWQIAESIRVGFAFSSNRVLRPQIVTVK